MVPVKVTGTKKTEGFPLDHYSKSTFVKFSTNPIMFKINAINGDVIETTSSASSVLGRGLHRAMQTYFGANPEVPVPAEEGEAITLAYDTGRAFLDSYSDGLIHWGNDIPDRAKIGERYSFAFFEYIKGLGHDAHTQTTLLAEKMLRHRVAVAGHDLPVPLKGSPDWVYKEKGLVKIVDHKFTSKHSGDDKIDGDKLLQAAFYYFLTYAETGEEPYSITFAECKFVPNQDKSKPQVKRFTIIYQDVPLMFDLFYRMYQDVTDALLGKMVYVPNFNAFYDNEVSLLAYIHRLDDTEEQARQFKKAKVDNITDFLRRKIAKSKSLNEFMETAAKKFVSAATLNYSTMTTEEKIKMKLAEHGIGLEFDSKIVGPAVTLYRYDPSVGVKMTKLENYAKDIELVTSSTGVRILAPISGTDLVGFEVPNKDRTFLGTAPKAQNGRVAVGIDIQGTTQYIDLQDAPHVLIAGSTGSGKSVFLNSIIAALGKSVDLWLMDPKQVELQDVPSVRYSDQIEGMMRMLKDLVDIMKGRYKEMKAKKIKTWEGRKIVAVVDEFQSLTMQSTEGFVEWKLCEQHLKAHRKSMDEVMRLLRSTRRLRVGDQIIVDSIAECDNCEKHVFPPASESILRLAAEGRAAGIHLIIATQSPRVDVITGNIKANFPTRVALKVASPADSEVILGVRGAEKLTGKGDMLLVRSTDPDIVRLQGFAN